MANKLLKSITFPDLTDKYIVGDTSLSVSGAAADAKVTGDAFGTKANADGYYENLTAGSANQLLSTVTIEDKVPYQFRTSGGSADIGDRETDMLVGGSIAWNQLVRAGSEATNVVNGITIKANSDGTIELNGTATSSFWLTNYMTATLPTATEHRGHKVLISFSGNANIPNGTQIGTSGLGYVSYQNCAIANEFWSTSGAVIQMQIQNGVTYDNAMLYPQFFDLTQMFGSTIADYIYSLEQSTAGAGVAWFKKLFPKPYYAYDAGTLKSVEGVSSHDMVGFNAWDEEWEVGGIDVITGEPYADNNIIRSKNFIRVMPSAKYYVGSDSVIHELYLYDANKDYKYNAVNYASNNGLFTMPEWCCYIKFRCKQAYGTTYKNDICINLSWDGERNGEYEPYVKQSYSLDDSLTLRGIPKLDSANSLYYDGDIYESDGTVTRKYGIVDLGSLTWHYSTYGQLTATLNGIKVAGQYDEPNMLCPKLVACKYSERGTASEGSPRISVYDVGILDVRGTGYTDATAFATAMSGVYLVYELATPTTESADPYTNPQIVDDFGTEEYVTTSLVPVGHVTQYQPNLRAKLEMAPNSPDGDGDYIVRQTNGQNEYVPLVIEDALPATPSEDGTYNLKVTVADGVATMSWGA